MAADQFHLLARLGVTVRPLVQPPKLGNRLSPFRVALGSTVGLLARELRALDAKAVVLELDMPDRMVRLDGLPRADARPDSPAVALSFESQHGRLRYVAGEFRHWHDNLRAVALGLEALRAVDRYGITRRGEQYVGYRELTTGGQSSRADAIAVIRGYTADRPGTDIDDAVRLALRRTHPDVGGRAEDFLRVQAAKAILRGGREPQASEAS